MKIVFFGTPKFGADVLAELLLSTHEVVGAVCQTDKKGNRNKIEFCEVKTLAAGKSIPVLQFKNVNENVNLLKNLKADIFITAAYGQILSQEVIDAAKFGTVNVHPSLLPKYRGATPVQAALLNGDNCTGVTIAKTVKKLDSGAVLAQKEIEILPGDDSASLLGKTAKLGGLLLVGVLDSIESCLKNAVKQDEGQATYVTKIISEVCKIDFSKSAAAICNQVRALSPEPSAFCFLNDSVLKVFKAQGFAEQFAGELGEVVGCDKKGLFVKCADSIVSLSVLQLAGGKVLNFTDLINGRKIALGDLLK